MTKNYIIINTADWRLSEDEQWNSGVHKETGCCTYRILTFFYHLPTPCHLPCPVSLLLGHFSLSLFFLLPLLHFHSLMYTSLLLKLSQLCTPNNTSFIFLYPSLILLLWSFTPLPCLSLFLSFFSRPSSSPSLCLPPPSLFHSSLHAVDQEILRWSGEGVRGS